MRVALVAHWFGEFCVSQANGLAEQAEVHLMCPQGMLGLWEEVVSDRVNLVNIPKHGRRSLKNLFAACELAKLIKSVNPDVIHFHTGGHMRLMLALPWLRSYPVVATVHDPSPHPGESTWVLRWADRTMRRRADHFILHGESLCRIFHETWGVPRERMTPIQLGAVEFSRWRDPNLELPARGHLLLFGRIQRYKGIPVLIEAAERLKCSPEQLKIVIAGRGDDMAPHRAKIESTGQSERFVILNEFIPEPMADALFAHARAIVLPYTEASQSGPATAALVYGKPVIASNIGGLPEIVRDGETGLLVPPNDPEALAQAIDRIVDDQALADKLAEGAKRVGRDELSWSALAAPTIDVYNRAIAHRRSQRGR